MERFLEENTGSLDTDEVNLNVVLLETVFQDHAALLKEIQIFSDNLLRDSLEAFVHSV